MQLRPYQLDAVDQAREKMRAGHDPVLISLATGGGKTVVFSYIVRKAMEKGQRVCILAHRTELIDQASDKCRNFGIPHGIIQGGRKADYRYPIQIASVQTLVRRHHHNFDFDLIVVDEAHHVTAGNYLKIINRYPRAKVVGLTATPYRADGKSLGDFFRSLVHTISTRELIEQGFLVPPRVYAGPKPDLKGVGTRAGDWKKEDLASVMDRPRLVGDVVSTYQRFGEERTSVYFAVNIAHSIHLSEQFNLAGIPFAHLDGDTPTMQRRAILSDLATGRLRGVSNANVLTEGFDLPRIGVVGLLRPTKSRGLWKQMAGRGLRPDDGKVDCIILDHAGSTYQHGLLTDPETLSLSRGVEPGEGNSKPRVCEVCTAVISRKKLSDVARENLRYFNTLGDFDRAQAIESLKTKTGGFKWYGKDVEDELFDYVFCVCGEVVPYDIRETVIEHDTTIELTCIEDPPAPPDPRETYRELAGKYSRELKTPQSFVAAFRRKIGRAPEPQDESGPVRVVWTVDGPERVASWRTMAEQPAMFEIPEAAETYAEPSRRIKRRARI